MPEDFKEWATGVADAIREKKGTTEKIKAKDFEEEIRSINTNNGGSSSDAEIYEGAYTVVPSSIQQSLETRNKLLTNNVIVMEIPVATVSNESGGNTITIGEALTNENGALILLNL